MFSVIAVVNIRGHRRRNIDVLSSAWHKLKLFRWILDGSGVKSTNIHFKYESIFLEHNIQMYCIASVGNDY